MDKIKIVFIIGTLEMGGTERQFVETLRRLDRMRFECKVLSFRRHGPLREELDALQIPFHCLNVQDTRGVLHPLSYVQTYMLSWNIYQYLKREKPHIVQSHLFWPNIHACIAGTFAKVPVIITGRRATMSAKHQQFRKYTKRHYRWLQNISNHWATAIIANSEVIRQHCLAREKFITAEDIYVICNGIDSALYNLKINVRAKKQELGISPHAQVVGMIASLHPRKGHRDFLEAAVNILETHPETCFLIIGRNDGIQTELERLSERLDIRRSIIFTGERHDIPELLSILDVQVSSSYIEGQSNAILEGMAAGKAIVSTDAGGNAELMIDGQSGLLVPVGAPVRLGDAVKRLLSNQSLRKELGDNARQRVATQFQFEQLIHQTEALYDKLVRENERLNRDT